MRKDRLPSLDGIRAFSILCVISSHTNINTHGILDGTLGVRIFFVISGFIITTLLLKEEKSKGEISLKNFYFRRVLRILPALWAYLITIAILGSFGVFPSFNFKVDILRPATFTFWPTLMIWQVRHTWSLAIEEQFYLFWPTLIVFLPKMLRVLFSIVVIIFGPLCRLWIYQHPQQHNFIYTIFGNIDILMWGCLFGIVYSEYPWIISKIVNWRPTIARLSAIITIECSYLYFHDAFAKKCPSLSTDVITNSAQAIAIAFLIVSLVEIRKGVLFTILNFKLIRGIGVISYSMYLWQQLFLSNTNHIILSVFFIFIIGVCSYLFIEKPIISLYKNRQYIIKIPSQLIGAI